MKSNVLLLAMIFIIALAAQCGIVAKGFILSMIQAIFFYALSTRARQRKNPPARLQRIYLENRLASDFLTPFPPFSGGVPFSVPSAALPPPVPALRRRRSAAALPHGIPAR